MEPVLTWIENRHMQTNLNLSRYFTLTFKIINQYEWKSVKNTNWIQLTRKPYKNGIILWCLDASSMSARQIT